MGGNLKEEKTGQQLVLREERYEANWGGDNYYNIVLI